MAKVFYSQEEACAKLGMTAAQLKDLVQNGQVHEYRDAGAEGFKYKVTEIDKIATSAAESDDAEGTLSGSVSEFDMLGTGDLTLEDTGQEDELKLADEDDAGPAKPGPTQKTPPADEKDDTFGATGDLILEPLEEEDEAGSGIDLTAGDTGDALSLDDTTDTDSGDDDKEGTVVTSIGVSVFDEDDDIEAEADPLAQTIVADEGGEALGIDGVGSGSGLLDLTRESDDTSLGAELLEDIYPGGEGGSDMGDATRAGLVEAIPEDEEAAMASGTAVVTAEPSPVAMAPAAVTRYEYAPDAISTGLTGMLFVAVLIMCVAGLIAAATTLNVWPPVLSTLYENNWIVGAAGLGAAVVALGVGFMLGKRRG